MAEQKPTDVRVELPIVFLDAEAQTYEQANIFVLSSNQDGVHLTIGQVQLPLLLGTPEQQQAQARQLSYVGVKVLSKVVMTPERLRELRNAIDEHVRRLESG